MKGQGWNHLYDQDEIWEKEVEEGLQEEHFMFWFC